MRKNNYLRKSGFILFAALTIVLITATALFSVSCSNKNNVKTDTTMAADAQTSQSGKDSQSTSGSSTSSSSTTTLEQVPLDIQQTINEADKYYNNGQYGEAVSAYRGIRPVVEEDTNISASLKKQIIDSYSKNFEDSKTITETARMHYGNAMQLEYEKRIKEAIKELEEALKIYPKYQDAIDKLDSIKSLYKLK